MSDLFDPRLAAKVIKTVDVSYGGVNGFNQAIELSSDALSNVKFIQEKRLLQRYFDEIAMESGKYCFGVRDCLTALEAGAIETLIVWENLDVTRYTLKNKQEVQTILNISRSEEAASRSAFMDPETSQEMEVVEQILLIEWLAERYKDFGANLEFVTDRSPEGNQFVKGFGGIGGLLRYQLDFVAMGEVDDDDDYYDD